MKKPAWDEGSKSRRGEELELRERTMTFPTSDAMLRATVALSAEVTQASSPDRLAQLHIDRMAQLFPERAFALLWQRRGSASMMRVVNRGQRLRAPQDVPVVPDSLLQDGGAAADLRVSAPFQVGPYFTVCQGSIAGFALPLAVGQELRGLLFVEYSFAGAVNGLDPELLPLLAEHLRGHLLQFEQREEARRALEDQVLQSEKLATLGLMAAGVVHELNNPLTSICVYADYLRNKLEPELLDGGDNDKLDRIVTSAERVLRFARDLVGYARPSDGLSSPVSVVSGIEQAVNFCEFLINERAILVTRDFDPALPPVLADRRELVQVWVNLITNACQAMSRDGGELTLSVRREGPQVLVRVRDNGPGMSEEVLAHLFEPFFTTKSELEGTGLGLSVAKRIVERHGGVIAASSSLGEGSTLTVTLNSTLVALADRQ